MLPMLLSAGGSTFSLATTMTEVFPVITKGFELCTTAPVSYFLVLGIVGAGIGIFGHAKAVAR